MDDLVKRLRDKEIPGAIYEGTDESGPYVSFKGIPDPLCVAAADRIEAQAAEIARLEKALLRIETHGADTLSVPGTAEYNAVWYETAVKTMRDLARLSRLYGTSSRAALGDDQ